MGEPLRAIGQLRYQLFPGRIAAFDTRLLSLHNATFTFWKTFWSEVYRSVGESGAIDPADFYRQDVIGTLFDGDQIIALQAYTLFDLRSLAAREHSYFGRHFQEDAVQALEKRGASNLLTMEYLAVAPDWRSSRTGISLASVLLRLGLHVSETLGVDGVISSARADNGTDKMLKVLGAETLVDVTVHQRATALMFFDPARVRPHPSADVNRWTEHFWTTRTDWTTILAPDRRTAKAA